MKNYFVYLPESHISSPWECTATACGYTRVAPGCEYPPRRHPLDHHFRWEDGRVLSAYQIVFITEGQGSFESSATGRRVHPIESGTVFLLVPGIWHRYGPNSGTGWVEHWIECRGPAFDRALKLGVISPKKPIHHVGLHPDLLQCFDRCHAIAQRSVPGHQAALATLGLHLLALLEQTGNPMRPLPRRLEETIWRAQLLISQRCQDPLNVQELAAEMREGYSNFRQAFRQITGLSPKQYHVQVRLQRAQELLANTSKSVKEIADLLGFNSAFHLSNQFKIRTGAAPMRWRLRLSQSGGRSRQGQSFGASGNSQKPCGNRKSPE